MAIYLVAEHPELEIAIAAGTLMAAPDRVHYETRDGRAFVRVGGVEDTSVPSAAGNDAGLPCIAQGSDYYLYVRTVSNLSGAPNDLTGVVGRAYFRESFDSTTLEAEATVYVDPNDNTSLVIWLPAAVTDAMTAPNGVWDMEIDYTDTNTGNQRTKRVLQGRYALNLSATREVS